MSEGSQNGWNEYSKLVLKELETLAASIQALNSEIQELKQEIAQMRAKEDRIDEIKLWKSSIDEVVSPTQLKEVVNDIEDLKQFKIKAVTIFTVVQFLMAMAVAITQIVT
jgi:predicted nuclease with TOPRIM domain